MSDEVQQLLKRKLQFIIEGGSVIRYHTRPGIKPDTDAHHSHGVAMLCHMLSGNVPDAEGNPLVSARLLMAALTHDLGEQVASDVSSPSKRLLGIREELHELESNCLKVYWLDFEQYLDPEEKQILQWADMFDGMLYCCRELALGNKMMLLVYRRYRSYVQSIYHEMSSAAIEIYNAIQLIYKEYRNEPAFDCFADCE